MTYINNKIKWDIICHTRAHITHLDRLVLSNERLSCCKSNGFVPAHGWYEGHDEARENENGANACNGR